MPIVFALTIIAAAICGFAIAYYIWKHKQTGDKLVCPLDFDCEAVVTSKYASTFGFQNEILGMIYYAGIGLVYLIFIFYPQLLLVSWLSWLLLLASFGSFAFSSYLLYVQFVKLKEWCTWCIFSSLCSTFIFLSALGIVFL